MTPRLWRLAPLAALACLVVAVPRTASGQVGAATDIIVGTVTGPDSQPLAGATIEVTSRETGGARQVTTDARGRFTLLFPDGGGQYDLVVRYIGMAPAHLSVTRRGDEDRIVANVRMGLAAITMEAVSVTARRGGRSDQVGRGATGQALGGEEVARLPTDASDLNTVATLAPGVLAIPGGDTSSASFSVAGQRPTANNVTLDGMSLGSGEVPQDAVRAIRVVTNSYDVARGQFSGGLVASTTRSGTNTPQGSFTTTLRDRTVAWGDAMSTPFGQGMSQTQVGGGFGGPIVANRLFVFAALQGRWRTQALPSLATADAATLDRLGVSPDSASRFRALAGATGTPAILPGLPDDRAGSNTLGLLRLDWQVSPVHTVTLRLDGHWISQEPTHVSSLAFPATGARRSQRSGGVMASLTSYLGGHFVNEARGYVATDRKDVSALLALPAARVEVASPLADGGQDVTTLSFGGNGATPQRADDRTIELTDELSWLSGDARHRIKLGSFLNRTHVDDDQTPNQLGTFTFPSLAALSADSPSTFMRTLAPQDVDGTTWNAALYAGDTWHAASGLHVMYGVRVETAGFDGAPAANRTVDSLFGVRVDQLPRERHLSPRIGFTWGLGSGEGEVRHATYVRGGVGDFRSPAPSGLYSAVLGAPGTIGAETQVACVGTAVPTPDWSAYEASPAAIPSRCADSTSGATTPRPDVTTYDPRFTAPHAWRASLGLMQRVGAFSLTVDASYARGESQYGFRDLNLVGTTRFALSDEGGRPVYVPADSIVPSTGATSLTASREHPEFGHVFLIRSDLESETKQLTVAVAGATQRGATVRVSYTLTRSMDQSSFACCSTSQGFAAPTTAGDPNVPEWATSDLERRHALLATVNYPVSDALEIGAIGRLLSGAPFTPLVGSDVNGDGARNDRAFLFDPATAGDTAVASGMRTLLATASSGVRGCLERQLGRVAGRNSCTGAWQPSLDLQINWHPAWFGEDRPLTVSLLTVNLLGGLDEWWHGAAHRLGWGYATVPDPVLLYVRGFDPATERFRYAVNGRFGSLASAGGGIIVPFQIALQGRLTLGPGGGGERARSRSP
ncbi:MAG TPA: carboxypeptidase regulatory-like domain-containing protein [Gemmatimonadales bacterium]|jgi:hypothetical protein